MTGIDKGAVLRLSVPAGPGGKVIRDESAQSQESMLQADPIEAPEEKGAGLGFGGTVLAVMPGVIPALLLMSLF